MLCQCYGTLRYVTLCDMTLRYGILRCYGAVRCGAVRCVVLCCVVLCCAVLCFVVLCCVVLCCVVLCCIGIGIGIGIGWAVYIRGGVFPQGV